MINPDFKYSPVPQCEYDISNEETAALSSPDFSIDGDKSVNFRNFQKKLDDMETSFQALRKEIVNELKTLEQEVKLNNQEQNIWYSSTVLNDPYREEMQYKPVQNESEASEEQSLTTLQTAFLVLCVWTFYGILVLIAYLSR